MKRILPWGLVLASLLLQGALAASNTRNESYPEAKRALERRVYFDHRETLYCKATFNRHKRITLPEGFTTPSDWNRARRVEWEHVVPAENFGRDFVEWKFGAEACVGVGGQFRGRNCAERTNREFRLIQADMYNLFPAIGAVNKIRSNYRFTEFPAGTRNLFGTCPVRIRGREVEPPDYAKGEIARAALYMQWAYPKRVDLGKKQTELMRRWNERFAVSAWECRRAKRIEALQGNENPFVKEPCRKAGLW